MIVLEPSCASVFRDELTSLFPNDLIAYRLSRQTFLLADFLAIYSKRTQFQILEKKLLVQEHCHQKAVLGGMKTEKSFLEKLGMNLQVIDRGCCGMAGPFGYQKEHYELSLEIGKQSLMPAVADWDPADLVMANGFSCREQIRHLSGRRPLHLAQILEMSLAHGT